MSILTDQADSPETQANASTGQGQTSASGGSAIPQWVGGLPEPLRVEKSLHKFTDENWQTDLPKSYVELSRKLGSAVHIPKADADQAEWDKFLSRLRPETADVYELPAEGLLGKSSADVKKAAFDAGLTAKQLKVVSEAIAASESKLSNESLQKSKEKTDEAVSLLKQEFGKDFDANLTLARKAFETLFPGAAEEVSASGLDNNPLFIKGLVALGKRLGEDTFVSGAPAATAPKKDPYDWMNKYKEP